MGLDIGSVHVRRDAREDLASNTAVVVANHDSETGEVFCHAYGGGILYGPAFPDHFIDVFRPAEDDEIPAGPPGEGKPRAESAG